MKQILHRFFSMGLALLVLFSTVSLTVEKHYCGKVLIDASIFSEARKCGMEKGESSKVVAMEKSCCKDEIAVVEGQDELKTNGFDDLEFGSKLFISSFIYSFATLYESLPKQIIPHKDYSPPNLIFDIQLLDDVFLI